MGDPRARSDRGRTSVRMTIWRRVKQRWSVISGVVIVIGGVAATWGVWIQSQGAAADIRMQSTERHEQFVKFQDHTADTLVYNAGELQWQRQQIEDLWKECKKP